MKLEYICHKEDYDKTIKDIIQSYFHISHRLLVTLKKENCIYLNNVNSFIYKKVKENDKITIDFDYKEDNSNIVSKNIPLDIVYEDEWILIVNKQACIPVHPSILHYEDSLSNGIRYYFDKINLNKKIRPVNRLDKDTSGLVIFAKCEYIQEALINQMRQNIFKKEYIAIVENSFENKKGTIDAPIARKKGSIIERCVDDIGDKSITHYELLDEIQYKSDTISVVKCLLETGRTHQIRVHMSHIGHPLLGDDLYGGNLELVNRQALHCYKLSFIHPITKNLLSFESDIPDDMEKILKK